MSKSTPLNNLPNMKNSNDERKTIIYKIQNFVILLISLAKTFYKVFRNLIVSILINRCSTSLSVIYIYILNLLFT